MTKEQQRQRARVTRDAATAAMTAEGASGWEQYSAALLAFLIDTCAVTPQDVVAGFAPLPHEIDLTLFFAHATRAGISLALPLSARRGQPLQFARYTPGDDLDQGAFRVPVPRPEASIASPTVILVPLLAHNSDGFRLGYGGGFYDRTLAEQNHRATVGISLPSMHLEFAPEPHDRAVDYLFVGGTP
ncbi:MAG: 5-formyltetrahydrofolate cyclo-ligase [Alphaproteobacteria bacterium]|nr:5-formyltetrahydrofolate cyclo-ligase [Alphaproteobacteria bacterium]